MVHRPVRERRARAYAPRSSRRCGTWPRKRKAREADIKIIINGEAFDHDRTMPMSDALWIEDAYKRRYVQWEEDLAAGSAKAMCVLACLIWRRDGRDVPLPDLLDGTVDFDLGEMLRSMVEAGQAEERAAAEAEAAEQVPTPAGPDPAGTRTTSPATSASSRKSSAGRQRKSGS